MNKLWSLHRSGGRRRPVVNRGMLRFGVLVVVCTGLIPAPSLISTEDQRGGIHAGSAPLVEDPAQPNTYFRPIEGARDRGRAPVYEVGMSGWEPTLGVKGNKVFVSAAVDGGNGFDSVVARSLDGGPHWDHVAPKVAGRNPHAVSLDPYIHLDRQGGRLFMADLLGSCSMLSFSDDSGETWDGTRVACGPVVNDHENVFTGPPVISPTLDYPNIVYYCYNTMAAALCARSLDGGNSFLPPGAPAYEVLDPAASGGALGVDHFCFTPAIGHGVSDKDGTIYIPRGHCGQPWLAISRDEGLTWKRVQVADNGVWTADGDPKHEAAVGVDAKGRIYYGWLAADRLPYVAWSLDGGKSWSDPVRVGPSSLTQTTLPSLAVSSEGVVAIAFMGSSNAPGAPFPEDEIPDLGSEPFYEGATWNGYVVRGSPLSDRPGWRHVVVNPKRDPLVRGECNGGRCAGVGDFIDVQVDRAHAWGAFVDLCSLECARDVKGANDTSLLLVTRVPLQ